MSHAATETPAPRDAAARRGLIRRSLRWTIPASFGTLVAYWLLPPISRIDEPATRLAFALQWLLVALAPYAAVCTVILYLRYAEGAHDPLAGGESERLKVHCRVMQNTLEQGAWFAMSLLPLATLLRPESLKIIPVLCVAFAGARLLYWWGYFREGTLGRAPGVQLTFLLNIPLLVATLVLFARSALQ